MRRLLVLAALAGVGLGGCSTVSPIQQDQPLLLAAGDGIAAIQFDTVDVIHQAQIVSATEGPTLDIPTVPVGKSTYLFEVPAGRYCLQRFIFGKSLVAHQGDYVDCFAVRAGEVGFSGIYSPRSQGEEVSAGQNLDVTASKAALRRDYPHIAAQFLQPEPAPLPISAVPALVTAAATASANVPPPPGKDLISSWITHDQQASIDTIYVRNNTKWAMQINTFQLYDCANIKQQCTTTRPDFKLRPHETRVFMQIQPDDLQGAYSFHYKFAYGFD